MSRAGCSGCPVVSPARCFRNTSSKSNPVCRALVGLCPAAVPAIKKMIPKRPLIDASIGQVELLISLVHRRNSIAVNDLLAFPPTRYNLLLQTAGEKHMRKLTVVLTVTLISIVAVGVLAAQQTRSA